MRTQYGFCRGPAKAPIRLASLALAGALAACGGGKDDDHGNGPPDPGPGEARLACNESMKARFQAEQTTVLLVKAFKAGDPLLLDGAPTGTTPTASADVCVVKLLVGPGNPGPAGAPSTSQGIGIEAMDGRAAARTWGLLRAEERWIAAAIMPF